MSVRVELDELRDKVSTWGPAAFLVTVTPEGTPHIVSVSVAFDGGDLVAGAGRTTSANVGERPDVSLLWAPAPDGYSLIVDGPAAVRAGVDGNVVVVSPTRAVLHRTVTVAQDGPSCITVLDAR